jgi:eukaryotic-like serine/threonine-protein kinase
MHVPLVSTSCASLKAKAVGALRWNTECGVTGWSQTQNELYCASSMSAAELVAGKYELVRKIGSGGMGSVWEGRHVSLNTRVAVKFIEVAHVDNAEARNRFDSEARAAATIQSKYAIQIYDHGLMTDGRPYIVMEFLVGEPLDKRLQRDGALSLQETARIVSQVSKGLGRAHDRGIVHRDLKPENIFLVQDEEDGDEIAKVLDFGIAKIMGDGFSISNNTATGTIIGSPYYMSPEQARGLKTIDRRTDIWSLGVIAYRCVVGQMAFDGASVADLLVKICIGPLAVPSEHNAKLPSAFDAWFFRCLEREPEDRFSTVQEAATELLQIAGTSERASVQPEVQSVSVPPPSPPSPVVVASSTSPGLSVSPVPKSATRRLVVAGALGLVALGLVGLAVAKFSGHPGTEDDASKKSVTALAMPDTNVRVPVETAPDLKLAAAPDLTQRVITPGPPRAAAPALAPAIRPANGSVLPDAGARRPLSAVPKTVESPGF